MLLLRLSLQISVHCMSGYNSSVNSLNACESFGRLGHPWRFRTMLDPFNLPKPADQHLRFLLSILWTSIVISLIGGTLLCWVDVYLAYKTVAYDQSVNNGMSAGLQLTLMDPKTKWSWQLLLFLWFYPAKILIQYLDLQLFWQFVWYFVICLIATIWIWGGLVNWERMLCVTIYSKTIGEPIFYLFVPTTFMIYDWSNECKRRLTTLILRTPIEILLIFPWLYIWGFTQLTLGWLWI